MSRDRSCRSLPHGKGSQQVFGLGFLLTDPFPGQRPSGALPVRHPYRCASAPASHRIPWPAFQLVTDSLRMVRHRDDSQAFRSRAGDRSGPVTITHRGRVAFGG